MDTLLASALPPEALPADSVINTKPNKQSILARIGTLKKNRNTYEERWKAIRDYELPFLGEFDDTEDITEKGRRRDLAISNGVAWLANQAFAAGIMSGLTPPSRQWFKFGFSNTALSDDVEAARVLDQRQEIVEYILHRSNFYNSVHACYAELPFGQAPLGVFTSPETGVRFQSYTIGSYYLDVSAGNRVDTFARKVRMNAAQIAQQFGVKNLPRQVKDALTNEGRKYAATFDVWWLVMPNDKRTGSGGNLDMPYKSLYWVDGQDITENGGYLYIGGFREFPVPTARYQVSGNDVYAKGPGWYAEGESKALQTMKKDFLTAVEYVVKPPMAATAATWQRGINLIPGGVTIVDELNGAKSIGPILQTGIDLNWLSQEIVRSEDTIKRIYSADLFLMLESIDTPQMTAREVMERQQEKLQQLGPVVERLQDEFLNPVIERVYNILERSGLFPPLPQSVAERLANADIKIEYISPLAQAQKMSGLVNIEQALSFVGQMAQLYPDALKMVDPLGTVKKYFELLGAPAVMQRSIEDVQNMIQQEQEAMAQQAEEQQQLQQAQAMAPISQAAKNLTDAARGGNPALQNLLGVSGPGGSTVE